MSAMNLRTLRAKSLRSRCYDLVHCLGRSVCTSMSTPGRIVGNKIRDVTQRIKMVLDHSKRWGRHPSSSLPPHGSGAGIDPRYRYRNQVQIGGVRDHRGHFFTSFRRYSWTNRGFVSAYRGSLSVYSYLPTYYISFLSFSHPLSIHLNYVLDFIKSLSIHLSLPSWVYHSFVTNPFAIWQWLPGGIYDQKGVPI